MEKESLVLGAFANAFRTPDLRRKLRLPTFFPLYQVEDSHEQPYTLALGQAALLIEAESFGRLIKKEEEDRPIFC